MTSFFDLEQQVCIITGSSRGIGKATAIAMAAAGAKVVVSSRKQAACEEVVAEIRQAGGEAISVVCNISQKTQLQSLVDQTLNQYGRIDSLICNAAVNPFYGPMQNIDDDAFDKVMSSNVKSNFWLCNMVLPGMAEQGHGSVIIISSIAGMAGSSTLGAYAISKAADFQLARNLAVEWGPKGVRANCIAPGLVKTDFAKALWDNPKAKAYVESMTPLRRLGDPDDIAGVAMFLASPASRFITGQSIVADGGTMVRDAV